MGLENVMEETLMGTEEHLAKTKGGGGCPYASSSPSIRQDVKVGVAVWLLLWVTVVVTLTVGAKIRFAQRLNTVQEQDKDGVELHRISREEERRVWPQTAILLPALANHYNVHSLTVHQPQNYETRNGRQAWHFRSTQGHQKKQARADIILHTDVAGLQLTLKHSNSPSPANTSYTLSLTYTTALPPLARGSSNLSVHQNMSLLQQSTMSKVIKTLSDTWIVVDVTEYLQNWLYHESDLWVEVNVQHRLQQNDARREYPVHQFQPTVCVWDSLGDENASKSDAELKNAVKVFLEARVQEKIAWRLRPDSKQYTEENDVSRQRNRRSVHSSQCKVQWVKVSKQELGLGLVLFPNTLTLKYCDGSCHILDHSDIFSTNALFRAKYRYLKKSSSMPPPQCIPTSFHHQHFFVWDTDDIKMIKVWDLNAAKCGCR